MRKPRDYDSELRTLNDKAKQLKDRRLHQLGELVIATGADALPVEQLAGALLSAIDATDTATREGWRKRGAAFFQAAPRGARAADKNVPRPTPGASSATPTASEERA
jgi:hypothetical protein